MPTAKTIKIAATAKAAKATNPAKPLVLLIHGLRGDHHGLSELAYYLSKDFTVVNPDLPGTGETPESEKSNLDSHIAWLHDYCQKLPQKPYIIGHSMGSIIVSYFVARYPNDCRDKLVFLAPIFRSKTSNKISKIGYYALYAVLLPVPKTPKHHLLASKPVSYCISHYLTYDKSQQKRIDQLHYQYSGRFSSAKSLLADTKISMLKTTILPQDKKILICSGTHDRISPIKLARQVGTAAKNVTFKEFSNTGHLMNYEQPIVLAECITDFLLPH